MPAYIFQTLISLALLIALMVAKRVIKVIIERLGSLKGTPKIRIVNVIRYLNILMYLLFVLLLMMVWGVDYRGLLLFASSVLAVIGVALVAQWSILSNISAGVIIFFSFPARIGDTIEIIDGSNKMQGQIKDINLFQIILKDSKGQIVAYPNNLILQRPVVKVIQAESPSNKPENRLRQRINNREKTGS